MVRGILATGVALSALGMAGAAFAQEAPTTESEDITVVGTRTEQDVFEVPATVSTITAEEIEATLATDIKDLVRFEPGVSVRNSPARFTAALGGAGRDGNSGFNIRGLEGNRVLFMVDGVRVPDGFSFGPATFGRGDYVDLDLLSRVEILRGPASSLYGSDGIAGVVSFTTKDPSDYLDEGDSFGGRVRAAYSSADDSWAEGVSLSGRWGDWSAMAAYTRRDAHEQENQGENDSANITRTAPNPQDTESNAAMVRFVYQPSEAHRLRFTAEYSDRETSYEVLSARAIPPLAATSVVDLDGRDESDRSRYAIDYTYDPTDGFFDRAAFSLYYQSANVLEFSAEDRNTAADRTRLSTFDNDVWGASAQFEHLFSTAGVEHRVIYGGDYSVTSQEGIRDGVTPPFGETFPTRPFPTTDYTLAGLFIQDQISFMGGRVVFYPSLRYDAYELEPSADPLYILPIAGQSDSHVTPRLGIVTWPTENFGVFFNYAQGFKAPSPSQVNQGFTNLPSGYTSIPNPDLAPETSEAIELGIRFRRIDAIGAEWRASANVFSAWYDDFIDQVQVGGTFAPGDPAIFQFINLGEVNIWGFEARADGSWDNGFGADIAFSFAEGDQTVAGVTTPLQSIEPWKLVAGLSYDGVHWGGQIIATIVGNKEDSRIAQNRQLPTTDDLFATDSFAILDITGYWNVTEHATLRVGIFNVTDEKYWWWGDVRGVGATSATVDAYTQPGTNFSASIAYRF